MKNTLRQTSYVVPVGVGTAGHVFPRNKLEASFPNFAGSAGAGGAGLILSDFPY